MTSRTLTPRSGAGLVVSGGGISARVKRLHVKWSQNKSEGPDQVVITIANHTQRKVRLEPTRIRLVELRPRGFRTLARKGKDPKVPTINPVGAVVGGAMAGARLGGSLSGSLRPGGGMGGLAGGLGGAMAGAAVAVAYHQRPVAFVPSQPVRYKSDRHRTSQRVGSANGVRGLEQRGRVP